MHSSEESAMKRTKTLHFKCLKHQPLKRFSLDLRSAVVIELVILNLLCRILNKDTTSCE